MIFDGSFLLLLISYKEIDKENIKFLLDFLKISRYKESILIMGVSSFANSLVLLITLALNSLAISAIFSLSVDIITLTIYFDFFCCYNLI